MRVIAPGDKRRQGGRCISLAMAAIINNNNSKFVFEIGSSTASFTKIRK